MKLSILSHGQAFPDANYWNPGSYLLSHGDTSVLLECPPTLVYNLLTNGQHPNHQDALCITHTHPDHCCLLPYLHARWGCAVRVAEAQFESTVTHKSLTILGPEVLRSMYEAARKLQWREQTEELPLVWRSGQQCTFASEIAVSSFSVKHAVGYECLGYCCSASGSTIVYTGDTAEQQPEHFNRMIESADLWLVEGGAGMRLPPTHMSIPDIVRRAKDANVKKVAITHYYESEEIELMRYLIKHDLTSWISLAKDSQTIHI